MGVWVGVWQVASRSSVNTRAHNFQIIPDTLWSAADYCYAESSLLYLRSDVEALADELAVEVKGSSGTIADGCGTCWGDTWVHQKTR